MPWIARKLRGHLERRAKSAMVLVRRRYMPKLCGVLQRFRTRGSPRPYSRVQWPCFVCVSDMRVKVAGAIASSPCECRPMSDDVWLSEMWCVAVSAWCSLGGRTVYAVFLRFVLLRVKNGSCFLDIGFFRRAVLVEFSDDARSTI